MPTYEFRCRKCNKQFERVYSIAEYSREAKALQCPKCGSKDITRQISAFEVKTAKKS